MHTTTIPSTNTSKHEILSFIIPLMNEENTLEELFDRIAEQARRHCKSWEIIFIDDGSTDSSWDVVQSIRKRFPKNVKAIRFRTNIGKAGALACGYEEAKGDVVFTLDADLQDDPAEIPNFLRKLDEGFDIVSGWKRTRHDPWHKVLPSRVFNKMLSKLNGVALHDHNCGFKCYRREVVKSLPMYGEMHRMVPSLAHMKGFRTGEIPVQHHARQFGVSKYGVKRFLRGFMDMWTVYFLNNFKERPLHLMGGAAAGMLGFAMAAWAMVGCGITLGGVLVPATPILFAASVLLVMLGFIAELTVHREFAYNHPLPVAERFAEEQIKCLGAIRDESKTPRVLLVDDDQAIRRILKHQFKQHGWEVTEAHDIESARERIADGANLALLDLYMPGGTGLELLSEFSSRAPETKVIMLTSEVGVRSGVEAMKLGAADYLTKPFNLDEVLSHARTAIAVPV